MLSLIILSIVMALITLVAGWIPLLFPNRIDTAKLSQFGTGIILGSAFMIVIPESYEQIGDGPLKFLAGVSIIAGFLIMLGIDIHLSRKGDAIEESLQEDAELYVTKPNPISFRDITSWGSGVSFTTLGLTVHAAADGIALGSTQGNASNKLELLMFLSIIVHKAPAALSLTSVLLGHQKPPSDNQIKRDLILFSLSGPLMAILLGGLISLLNLKTGIALIPGMCLAFSGGTFLFIATHILEHARAKGSVGQLLALIAAGALCPVIASLIPE